MNPLQPLLAGYGNPLIVVDSADFDGTNDYMTRGAGLTGAADSKSGILSCWIRLDGGTSGIIAWADRVLAGGAAPSLQISWASSTLNVFVYGTDTAEKVGLQTVVTYSTGAMWRHLLASWDVAAAAGNLYINDVSDLAAPTLTNATLDYTTADFSVGATCSGATKLNGCLAEFYFAPGQYLDFSLVVNRRKFISQSGKPVHLGTTGTLPTGTAPIVYSHLAHSEASANFATNRGTGGDLTVTGTLTAGSTSPSD